MELYNIYLEKSQSIKDVDLGRLSVLINMLDSDQQKIIYAIILEHAKREGVDISKPPYSCSMVTMGKSSGSKDIKCECKNLPIELVKILSAIFIS